MKVETYFSVHLQEVENEPNSHDDTVKCKCYKKRLIAMEEEMVSLHKNKTWELVKRLKDHKLIECKWVYKIKEEEGAKIMLQLDLLQKVLYK